MSYVEIIGIYFEYKYEFGFEFILSIMAAVIENQCYLELIITLYLFKLRSNHVTVQVHDPPTPTSFFLGGGEYFMWETSKCRGDRLVRY